MLLARVHRHYFNAIFTTLACNSNCLVIAKMFEFEHANCSYCDYASKKDQLEMNDKANGQPDECCKAACDNNDDDDCKIEIFFSCANSFGAILQAHFET